MVTRTLIRLLALRFRVPRTPCTITRTPSYAVRTDSDAEAVVEERERRQRTARRNRLDQLAILSKQWHYY